MFPHIENPGDLFLLALPPAPRFGAGTKDVAIEKLEGEGQKAVMFGIVLGKETGSWISVDVLIWEPQWLPIRDEALC